MSVKWAEWRPALMRAADWIAVALAASLPISTSATGILAALLVAVLVPTLDGGAVRRAGASPVCASALALVLLAAVGMLWAEVDWAERLRALSPYGKLLVIPLLYAHFRRSENGFRVAYGFLAAAIFILAWSYWYAYWPGLAWRGKEFGVPVKDYITQSGVFVICIVGLADAALTRWRDGARGLPLAMGALAVLFLANVVFVTTGRTALVVLPVLALLFAYRRFGARGAILCVGFGGLLVVMLWNLSPYLRTRVLDTLADMHAYRASTEQTSTGQRLEFWRKSLRFVEDAPVIGHGTGSIRDQFDKAKIGTEGPASLVAANPHQQVFAVAIQLGLVGVFALFLMWGVHAVHFRGAGAAHWLGLVIVTQNVVGSQFNSHLFDFTQGWIYVVGVGVFGGMVARERERAAAEAKP